MTDAPETGGERERDGSLPGGPLPGDGRAARSRVLEDHVDQGSTCGHRGA